MATVSTGVGRSSRSTGSGDHTKSIGVQGNSNCEVLGTNRSSEKLSDVWPRHGRHPPSPPVRQRARYSSLHFSASIYTWSTVVCR